MTPVLLQLKAQIFRDVASQDSYLKNQSCAAAYLSDILKERNFGLGRCSALPGAGQCSAQVKRPQSGSQECTTAVGNGARGSEEEQGRRTGFNVNNPKPSFHGLQTSHKLQYFNFLLSVSLSVCLFPPPLPPPVTFNYFLYSEPFLFLGHRVQGELDYP